MMMSCFSRVHQRSVEVARQHLEEYQRALQLRYNLTSGCLTAPVVPPGPVHPPSEHLPAPSELPAAASAYIYNRPQVSAEVSMRGCGTSASPPHPASSLSLSSKFLPDECVSNTLSIQKPDYATRLSDRIMERVTEHLPERLRRSVDKERPNLSRIPLCPVSDRIGAIRQSLTDAAPLDPGLQSGSLSSREREEDVEKQRQELQEVQKRVMEQREAVALQERLREEGRQRREVEMEQMRRQKETLQALINTPEQVSGRTLIRTANLRTSSQLNSGEKKSNFLTHSQFHTLPAKFCNQRTLVRNASNSWQLC